MSVVKVGVMCLRAGDNQLPEPEGWQAAACGAKCLAVPMLGLTSPSGTQQLLVFPKLPPHFPFSGPSSDSMMLCVHVLGADLVALLQGMSSAPSTHGR